jgi:hypothetical protein
MLKNVGYSAEEIYRKDGISDFSFYHQLQDFCRKQSVT